MHERRVGVRCPVKPFQFERQLLYMPFFSYNESPTTPGIRNFFSHTTATCRGRWIHVVLQTIKRCYEHMCSDFDTISSLAVHVQHLHRLGYSILSPLISRSQL